MRILIIDNNRFPASWGAADLRRAAAVLPGRTVTARRAPEEDLPRSPSAYDRIVISGSITGAQERAPWIDRLDEFVREAIMLGRPILGVCYGHQTLARVLGGRECLRKSLTPELGWTRIEITSSSPILKGLPQAFYSFSAHFDEVYELPQGTKLLAKSDRCAIQAFELDGKPVFGIQFHPERSAEDAERFFHERRQEGKGPLLLNTDRTHQLYDSTVCSTIFKNFLEL